MGQLKKGTLTQMVMTSLDWRTSLKNGEKDKATGLLLRILDYTIACAQSYSKWYVIDSHARNSRGMADDKGLSVVLKFDNFDSLIQYVRYLVEAATSQGRLNINR